jgi:hypothetical protein
MPHSLNQSVDFMNQSSEGAARPAEVSSVRIFQRPPKPSRKESSLGAKGFPPRASRSSRVNENDASVKSKESRISAKRFNFLQTDYSVLKDYKKTIIGPEPDSENHSFPDPLKGYAVFKENALNYGKGCEEDAFKMLVLDLEKMEAQTAMAENAEIKRNRDMRRTSPDTSDSDTDEEQEPARVSIKTDSKSRVSVSKSAPSIKESLSVIKTTRIISKSALSLAKNPPEKQAATSFELPKIESIKSSSASKIQKIKKIPKKRAGKSKYS